MYHPYVSVIRLADQICHNFNSATQSGSPPSRRVAPGLSPDNQLKLHTGSALRYLTAPPLYDLALLVSHHRQTVQSSRFPPCLPSEPTKATRPLMPQLRVPTRPRSGLKPVVKGAKDAYFESSVTDWDGKYHHLIGTSTRDIVFGARFVLTEYAKLISFSPSHAET